MPENYPIDCESCGCMIVDDEDDYNGMCDECYNTPPDDL